jgi:transcriptional regulator with XRE-family HTH domain
MIKTKLSDKIKSLREKKKLSLSELARQANVSKGYIYQLEEGNSTSPSAEMLFRIAGALGVTLAELMGKETAHKSTDEVVIPKALEEAFSIHPEMKASKNMLANLEFRGKRPKTKEDWFVLYQIIKNTIDR